MDAKKRMGTFTIDFEVWTEGYEPEVLQGIVDTGSTFTVIPRPVLERLDVKPLRTVLARLADGSAVSSQLGVVWLRVGEQAAPTLVTFGEPGELTPPGAYTPDGLLLGVDPIAQRLIPVEAVPGTRVSRAP